MISMTHRVYTKDDDYQGRTGLVVHVASECPKRHRWSVELPGTERLQLKKDRPRFWYRYAESTLLAAQKLRASKVGKHVILTCASCDEDMVRERYEGLGG